MHSAGNRLSSARHEWFPGDSILIFCTVCYRPRNASGGIYQRPSPCLLTLSSEYITFLHRITAHLALWLFLFSRRIVISRWQTALVLISMALMLSNWVTLSCMSACYWVCLPAVWHSALHSPICFKWTIWFCNKGSQLCDHQPKLRDEWDIMQRAWNSVCNGSSGQIILAAHVLPIYRLLLIQQLPSTIGNKWVVMMCHSMLKSTRPLPTVDSFAVLHIWLTSFVPADINLAPQIIA